MSVFEKLIEEILNLSKDMRFDELAKILIYYGYEMKQPKGGSSHYVFRKTNHPTICIPKHNPKKKKYVMEVKEIIEEEAKK